MNMRDKLRSELVDADVLRRAFDAMHRINRMFASVMETDELLKSIVEIGENAVEAEASALLLYDPDRDDLYFSVAHGMKGDQERLRREVRLPMGTGIAGLVAKTRTSVSVEDAQHDDRFYPFPDTITGMVTQSVAAAPMVGHHELVGVIEVINKRDGKPFTSTDVEVLEIFAQQAALAVQDMRLLEANVQAERLAAVGIAVETLSHATKNLLARIVASGELIDYALAQQDMDMLRNGWQIQKEAVARVEALVENMLAFGRIAPRTVLQLPCLLSEVLEEIVSDHDLLFRNRSIEIATNVAPVPESMVDREALRHVLVNLVGNAIDAVPEKGGRISLALGRTDADDASYIAVADNGPGIPQNMLTQVFTPFFTTKGSRGNGLGLAVARKISKERGWSLTVSVADPAGASFRIEIPDEKKTLTGEQRES
jgi:signal transduction histidine kinase